MQNESKNRFCQCMLSICLLLEEGTEEVWVVKHKIKKKGGKKKVESLWRKLGKYRD